MSIVNQINWDKVGGLVPTIIQNSITGSVLMLAYMNREALELSIEKNIAFFFSRSKNRLWMKGETSGNKLKINHICLDCDQDSLLILVEPVGPTCHTGLKSCFGDEIKLTVQALPQLQSTINNRMLELPINSYTTTLVQSGINKIAQKVGEEAVETVVAALNENDNAIIDETADLLYHLIVLLSVKNISLYDIYACLNSRMKPKK